jgi:retron-type reverse transcriptase
MNLSIHNIWNCWYLFRKGNSKTKELQVFEYELEKNLLQLHSDLNRKIYQHGSYCQFTVFDSKKREIVVAPIRDRIVHRMVYEYLVPIFDKKFIYDVWSCRKGKGLEGAIKRAQFFAKKYKHGFVWRTDIKKFFDSVDQEVLLKCIERHVADPPTLQIIREIILSYRKWEYHVIKKLGKIVGLGERERERERKRCALLV